MSRRQVISSVADVYGVPDKAALRGKFESQLVQGETFIVSEEKNGWCKGVCSHDTYPGYIESRHLSPHIVAATHIVTAARSDVYRDPSIKSPLVNTLSFGSRIKAVTADAGFVQLEDGGWLYEKHALAAEALEKDYLASAHKFLETPYYWGGRSGFGIDCSGLVQVCLGLAGIAAPRDSEDQEKALGKVIDGAPQSGDIVFFKGHVGFMADAATLLHANAFHMNVSREPLDDVTKRATITSIKRI